MKRTANVPQRTPLIVAPCCAARMIARAGKPTSNANPRMRVAALKTAIAASSDGVLRGSLLTRRRVADVSRHSGPIAPIRILAEE